MPYFAPLAAMPTSSSAPRLAEMNARPVTHVGIERADVRKSADVFHVTRERPADTEDESDVGDEDGVINPLELDGLHKDYENL